MRNVMDYRKTSQWFSWTVFLILAVCISSVPAYAARTLKGTLNIQFDGIQPNLTEPVTFEIFDVSKVAKIPVPVLVNGMPFRGQEFTVRFNGCTGTLNAGHATLIVERKGVGDTYAAYVTNGVFLCLVLPTSPAMVIPWNPFTNNVIASSLGEAGLWFRQILDADPDENSQTNEQEILEDFGASSHRKVDFKGITQGHSGFGASDGCTEPIGKITCNNGGSGSGQLTNYFMIKTLKN